MVSYCLETPIGYATIKGDSDGLSSVSISDSPSKNSEDIPEVLLPATEQIRAYFSKELTEFKLKLNPQGTTFQQIVWKRIMTIPFGTTISYLELSKQIGNVKAIRAVASANGKNPLWIIIPCHRVIGSNGSLTGYAGGLFRKKWLLEHEGALKQTSLF